MGQLKKLGICVLFLFLAIALLSWQSGTYAEYCNKIDAYEKHCTSYNLAPFIFIEVAEFFHRFESVFVVLSTVAIAWRKSVEQRRCLVPATSFAKPDQEKPVNWHWLALKGNSPPPIFAFASICQSWKVPIKEDGPTVEIETYSFFTTKPNALTARINHERMPVLLAPETRQDVWLNGSAPDALRLIQSYPAEDMFEVQAGLDKEDLEQQGTAS